MEMYTFPPLLCQKAKTTCSRWLQSKRNFRMEKDKQQSRQTRRNNKADADVLRKLAGEANNINQLAHKANAGGFAGVATELMLLKKKIVQIIKQLSDDWKNK